MARKSKYAAKANTLSSDNAVWKAGLYVRLSREDGDKAESDSIANQRSLLRDFASLQDDIEIAETYIDDGFSGVSFERPGFTRMLEELRGHVINCVIVKDLSRLGRNYIEVGQYIEKIFPLLHVRFISVNDMLDSVKNPQSMNNLVVPFKNIINDEYCRDISNKVRSSLTLLRRQGKCIASFPTYGYLKDPADHSHLVVDETAAEVVRSIYGMFTGGMSIIGIAKRLNLTGVPNPTAYKLSLGMNYRHPKGELNDGLWPDSSVRRILKNRIYTGCLAQGKNTILSYKLPVSVSVPERDWIVVPGTHEAIITQDIFDRAQELFTRDMRAAPGKSEVYLLSGFLKCADCGRAMNRKTVSGKNRDYCYYICSTFKKMDAGACTKHTIRSDKVEAAVLEALRKQIELAVEMDGLIKAISNNAAGDRRTMQLQKQLAEKEAEKEKLEKIKLDLYPDFKSGLITKIEYQKLRLSFDARLGDTEAALENLRMLSAEAGNLGSDNCAFLSAFTDRKNLTVLTREVLTALVDSILVHEGGAITINFKFADEFRRYAEYIRSNSGQVSA